MLRTLLSAGALLALAVPPVQAANPAWTDSDSVLIVYADGVVGGSAECHGAGVNTPLRYASATVYGYDVRGSAVHLQLNCTIWAGSVAVAEVSTSGDGVVLPASGNRSVALAPTHVCVWGWWTEGPYGGPIGSRSC